MSFSPPRRFVGLHSHSGASAMDGLGSPQDHIGFCKENGLDAWSATEHGHMNSLANAYLYVEKLNKAGEKFKFIPGAELYIHPDLEEWKKDLERDKEAKANAKEAEKLAKKEREKNKTLIDTEQDENDEVIEMSNSLTIENEEESKGSTKFFNPVNRRHHLVVLPKTSRALQKLFHLVSRGYLEGFYRFPRIDFRMLKQAAQECDNELIVSSACIHPDTILITNHGQLTIKEIVEMIKNNEEVLVLSCSTDDEKLSFEKVVWGDCTRKNAKLIQLKLKNGMTLKLTPDHKVFTKRGWIEARHLTQKDRILSVS